MDCLINYNKFKDIPKVIITPHRDIIYHTKTLKDRIYIENELAKETSLRHRCFPLQRSYNYFKGSSGAPSLRLVPQEGNSIMIGGKTLVITYQPNDYYSNDSHNLALYINNKRGRTEKAQLFMVTAPYKSLKPFYTWGDSISKKKIQNDYVSLPVDSNKNLDFYTMEQLITIQEKLAIKSIIKWKDKIINTSKKCI